MPLKIIWIVSPVIPYEGLGEPIGAFTSEKGATQFVDDIRTKAKKAHKRVEEYEVSPVYINPSSLKQVEE
jgi:hypothetical protein